MQLLWEAGNKKTALNITLKCNGRKKFRIWAEERDKENSRYVDRMIEVDGQRTIYLSFPVSPKQVIIHCENVANINDADYTLHAEEIPLKTYNVWLDEETQEFLQFAINFCQTSGFVNLPKEGVIKQSKNGNFKIKYLPVITDNGVILTTPARVGHQSKIIEISKSAFDKYTVAQRLAILLHEFSHVFKNPRIGLEISNEVGADLNALYIYLGTGWSKIDAITVFCQVFFSAQTPQNMDRIRKIQNYIAKFESGAFAKRLA